MPRSSLRHRLPVVTPLERLPQSEIDSLRRYYQEVCLVSTTPRLNHNFYYSLMTGIFRFLGSDYMRYKQCFGTCINVCKSTRVIHATSWNDWNGFAKILNMMETVERLTRHTNMLHCPSAPFLVVAIAMQQVILHNKIGEHDKVSCFFRDFDCHNKAATAIYHYDKYRQDVLTLDQVWSVAPFALQRPPNRTIEQSNSRSLGEEMPTRRNNTPSEVVTLDDEPDSVKREPPNAHQAPLLREERREDPVRVQVPTPMPVPTPTPMPTPTSMPMSMPALVTESLKQVFRADAMMQLQPLLDRLKSEGWNGAIQRDIMQVLTDKNVKVLTSLAKNILSMWAAKSENTTVLSWLEQAREDVCIFQWTERYVEPAPSAWINPQSAHTVFHDLDAMITGIPQLTIRGPLQAKMNTLRDIFDRQEKSHKDEMLNRVDSLQMDIAKLHNQMAESKQTEEQAMGASVETDDEAAETDGDVIVIETDEDDDDLEEEKKRKKRKGEKKQPKKEKKLPKEKKEAKKEKKLPKKEKKNGEKTKKRSHQEMVEAE